MKRLRGKLERDPAKPKYLKTVYGVGYTLGARALSLLLGLFLGPIAGNAMGRLFWFFTFRPKLWPILAVIPAFAPLGAAIP